MHNIYYLDYSLFCFKNHILDFFYYLVFCVRERVCRRAAVCTELAANAHIADLTHGWDVQFWFYSFPDIYSLYLLVFAEPLSYASYLKASFWILNQPAQKHKLYQNLSEQIQKTNCTYFTQTQSSKTHRRLCDMPKQNKVHNHTSASGKLIFIFIC